MNTENKKVITRFAPSPTGLPHLGTAMYAILNYIYAHQNGGQVLMRSEDTDPVRSKLEYEKAIIDGLAWLGIKADDFYRQTDRLEIYKKYIAKMIADGTAYISPDTNEKGETRDVVRFKNPNKIITFRDCSRGDISVDTTDLKDFIIARDVDSPLYHLTVVVDDYETGVTHVIRGEDGLANTPRQILIQEAIGAPRPIYAHFPFIILPNRTKMGKRNGAKSIQEYREAGYLPEAIVNFIILMAWHPTDDRELFTIPELLKEFQLERIGKSGAILDEKKLDWINKEYLKHLSLSERNTGIRERLSALGIEEKISEKVYSIIFDQISKWGDIDTMVKAGDLDYFFKTPQYPKEMLYWTKSKTKGLGSPEHSVEQNVLGKDKEVKEPLEKVLEIFSAADEKDFENPDDVKNLIWGYAEEQGRGAVLWPLRVALSGQEKSPDPFTLASTLGKPETLSRIQKAIEILGK